MIQYVTGDILLSQADAIAHGIAPNDHFNSGLALSLRERWPAMAKDFRHWCHNVNPKPGNIWHWAGPERPRIINLLTQEGAEGHHGGHPGKAKLEHVNHTLKHLKQFAEQEQLKSLALPKLATGVGGLDWPEVKHLIQNHLSDLNIPIFIYEVYQKDVVADEKLLTHK